MSARIDMDNQQALQWQEFSLLWDSNNFRAAHDWLLSRWNQITKTCLMGQADRDAQFLQGLAFAALALYFTQHANQEGALLMLDDAMVMLTKYVPSYQGVAVEPILESLARLRPLLIGLDPAAACPLPPPIYSSFQFAQAVL